MTIPPKFPLRMLTFLLALVVSGCVTPPRIPPVGETEDERTDREVFHENWIRPSVSQEDVDFFYRPFWRNK